MSHLTADDVRAIMRDELETVLGEMLPPALAAAVRAALTQTPQTALVRVSALAAEMGVAPDTVSKAVRRYGVQRYNSMGAKDAGGHYIRRDDVVAIGYNPAPRARARTSKRRGVAA